MAIDLEALSDKHEGEFLKFERVTNRRSQRPDLHAFLLLDEILPPKPTIGDPSCSSDMVASAGHDEIWLDTDIDQLAEVATEDQWIELVRCGVRIDDGYLAMFV